MALALALGLDECFLSGCEDKNLDEFIEFKDNVNNETSYSEMIVFLELDIDLTGKAFERIGTSSKCQFRGVFDEQGHVVSNLNMNSSSSQYVGYSDTQKD